MATVQVRFWAGARRAAGHAEETLDASDVGALRATLAARPELAKVVESASFLVDEVQASDTAVLRDGSVVDVLPPFAGGSRCQSDALRVANGSSSSDIAQSPPAAFAR